MARRSEFNPTRQGEIVLMLLRREEPGATLARRYGVPEGALYRWRDEFLQAGQAALGNVRVTIAVSSALPKLLYTFPSFYFLP